MTVFLSSLPAVYDVLLHRGIATYKKKNSKASLPQRIAAERVEKTTRQGGIFVVRQKEDFTPTGVKGFIVTSKEGLLQQANHLTHWTPNVYRNYHYTDAKRSYICGFEEKHLQQINTFVVDIDTQQYTPQDIIMTSLEEGIGVPTLIVASTRGYQVYYALEQPLFISNKNDFRSLTVAKRIADNLKRSLQQVAADTYCNDFGFFRIPNEHNIVFCQLEQRYRIADLIDWSMRQDDDVQRPLFVVPTKQQDVALTKTAWFKALLHTTKLKGQKGILGRNNTMFTLALACFSDGLEKTRTEDLLDQLNYDQSQPLSTAEIDTILTSAYSGKYRGPKQEYIRALLVEHVPNGQTIPIELGNRYWYKFKKPREERKRSHYDEWEADIIAYITTQKQPSEPFIWRTQKELCEAVGISQSSLNALLQTSTKLMKTVTGKGRAAKTGWTTVQLFLETIMTVQQQTKQAYRKYITLLIADWVAILAPIAGYEKCVTAVYNYKENVLLKDTS